MSGIPTPSAPRSNIRIEVRFPGDEKEMSPSQEDTIEAATSRRLRNEGITEKTVTMYQDVDLLSGGVMPSPNGPGGLREPDDLRAIVFDLRESALSIDQINRAQRIILGVLRDFEMPATEEQTYVISQAVTPLGSL